MDIFSAPHFRDDKAARAFLEKIMWPEGPVCRHCGTINHTYKTKKPGIYRCAEKGCRKDFSVTKGTILERSHIALHKWLQAFHLMASSKKGISAHQLHRSLDITYEAAWFMVHRIREAMRDGSLSPLGGEGKVVEADEIYHGKISDPVRHSRPRARKNWKPTKGGKSGPSGKRAIVGLVERGGKVRIFHVAVADKLTVTKMISDNIAKETRLLTDESRLYLDAPGIFKEHETVKHSAGEYARYDEGFTIHTNTVEGVFSIFKRGIKGIYQHCHKKHLHRYLAEYDFRYNNRTSLGVDDKARTLAAVKGAEGKRLTYHQPHSA